MGRCNTPHYAVTAGLPGLETHPVIRILQKPMGHYGPRAQDCQVNSWMTPYGSRERMQYDRRDSQTR